MYSTSEAERPPTGPSGPGVRARNNPAWADEEPEGESELNIAALIKLFWTNIWIIILSTIVCVGYSAWSFYKETPHYTASATVVVEAQDAQVIEYNSVVPRGFSSQTAMNTEILLLRSHDLMGRIVDALALQNDPEFNAALRPARSKWKEIIGYDQIVTVLGLEDTDVAQASPPDRDATLPSSLDLFMDSFGLGIRPPPSLPTPDQARETAISILYSKLRVAQVESTFAFSLTATTENPRKSAEIANKFAELYVAKKREIAYEATRDAMAWLSERVLELKGDLENAESAVEEFASRSGVISEESLLAGTQRLASMRESQAEQRQAAIVLAARTARLKELRAKEDFGSLRDRLDDLQLRALAGELSAGEKTAAKLKRFDALFDDLLAAQTSQAKQSEIQAATLARPISEIESEIATQSDNLVQLRQLRREAEAARLVYEYSLRRMKEISVQEGLQQADVRVLSDALVPGGPASPKASSIVFRGGAMGIVLGIALVVLRNMLRTTVRTPEELEKATGLTVMGVIPSISAPQPRALLEYVANKPASSLAESVRNLRTAIQLSNMDASPQSIMITSSLPGEGKTSTSIALAQSWASAGKRVLLVDCDLRLGSLKRQFKISTDAGLIAVLSGSVPFEEAVHHDKDSGIDVLIAGSTKVTGVDVFGSKSFETFMRKKRTEFDYIVLDSPPVLAVPDARVIAQNADAVIHLVRWNDTSRRLVRSGLESLFQVNVRIAGLALTRVNAKQMDRYGYYGFGYGGSITGKYYSN